ncbi:MAG: FAD-binding protein [Bacteroidales bacterium]|nr:FAD-binding protein [Bacteroidales bacterium]
MIRIEEIVISPDGSESRIPSVIASILNIKSKEILSFKIAKRAIDSRNKSRVNFVFTVDFEVASDEILLKSLAQEHAAFKRHRLRIYEAFVYNIPFSAPSLDEKSPVIVGSGPCGLFAALYLARAGRNPLIIERGKAVEERIKDVDMFMMGGALNPESNIQFGEGGAGTFSDGKLYTLVNDPRTAFIFETLVKAGAPHEILVSAKPHVGTDKLRLLLKNLRTEIIRLGGRFLFETRLDDLIIENDCLSGIIVNENQEILTNRLVLATGHSARDTFAMLHRRGLHMEQKIFSMGLRIEHPRTFINQAQYGKFASHPALGAAPYKLAVQLTGGRSAYSFCMCPGGMVVPGASEPGYLVTNGMSEYAQDAENSNSALLVNVGPKDFGSNHPLAGVEYQRKYEKLAFELGGRDYHVPVQRVADFMNARPTKQLGKVLPSYKPGYRLTELSLCLPAHISKTLHDALPLFDARIRGFMMDDAVLSGVESRSSSPLRILRNTEYQSNIRGVYPAGEGAGYAGGIVSSALDGLRIAEAMITNT